MMKCYYSEHSGYFCIKDDVKYECNARLAEPEQYDYFNLKDDKQKTGIYLRYILEPKTEMKANIYCHSKNPVSGDIKQKIKLFNPGNSCFMDTVLICLFAQPNQYILNKIVENKTLTGTPCEAVHNAILNVYHNMQLNTGERMCFTQAGQEKKSNRPILKECRLIHLPPDAVGDDSTQGLFESETSGSAELFVKFLVKMYKMGIAINVTEVKEQFQKKDAPVEDYTYLEYTAFQKDPEVYFTEINNPYILHRITESGELALSPDTDVIIFNNETHEIDEHKTIGGAEFNLTGIVIHDSGHYVSIIKYFEKWYLYDDLSKRLDKKYENQLDVLHQKTIKAILNYFNTYPARKDEFIQKCGLNYFKQGIIAEVGQKNIDDTIIANMYSEIKDNKWETPYIQTALQKMQIDILYTDFPVLQKDLKSTHDAYTVESNKIAATRNDIRNTGELVHGPYDTFQEILEFKPTSQAEIYRQIKENPKRQPNIKRYELLFYFRD